MTHRIAMLVFPGFQLLDGAGPLAAFEAAEALAPGRYAMPLRVVALHAGGVRSSSGVAWQAGTLPRTDRVQTLLVAGGDGVDAALAQPALLRYLQSCAARGVRLASICSGSLLLAQAGLLDGRRATTHWSRSAWCQHAYPGVCWQPDRLHVRAHARLWSSAGISAGIDLALALIAEDGGDALARRVAQQLVVYYRRPGGQSQFSALDAIAPGERGTGFGPLLERVRRTLHEPHRVQDLAERACMSPRHFARRFQAETGVTPAQAVQRLRVEAARAALDAPGARVAQVAAEFGFGDAERMRRSFRRLLGVVPSALLRRG